ICQSCSRILNVRSTYLGRWVTCKHCNHLFVAERGDGDVHSTRSTPPESASESLPLRDEEGRTWRSDPPCRGASGNGEPLGQGPDDATGTARLTVGPDAEVGTEIYLHQLQVPQPPHELGAPEVRDEGPLADRETIERLTTTIEVLRSELAAR